jgi:hypothetical protein
MTIREPESPQKRYRNVRTVLLDPNKGSSFASEFLVRISRISGFPYFIGKRKPDEGPFEPVVDIDRDAKVVASVTPFRNLCKSAFLCLA